MGYFCFVTLKELKFVMLTNRIRWSNLFQPWRSFVRSISCALNSFAVAGRQLDYARSGIEVTLPFTNVTALVSLTVRYWRK